jgi:glycosyltransferase involved in cell wall biosynthesis
MDILAVYQFCSFGGVERVLLNRAAAFQKHNLDVRLHIGYLEDYGALESFRQYIHSHHLDDLIVPFLMDGSAALNHGRYDLVLAIDTPQIFEKPLPKPDLFVECHTPYIENRQYLRRLPERVRGVIAPSRPFRSLLMNEFPELDDVFVLPNPVPDDFYMGGESRKVFRKRPLVYLARIDALKNYEEAVCLFEAVRSRADIFQMVIGKGGSLRERVSRLEELHLLDRTFLRERIEFDHVPSLIRMVREHRGVFVSPSKGESFGLSAAEFICGGVPVLLSDIPEHIELVNHDERFLYPLGDVHTADQKLNDLLDRWDEASAAMQACGSQFRSDAFIACWQQFLLKYVYS